MKCSLDSVRRFVKQFLELKDTPYCFHQTLTFRGDMTDRKGAKTALEKLLNVLHKQFDTVCLFTEQGHATGRVHFHLVFFFYLPQPRNPESLRQSFGAEVFKHWHRITGGTVVRAANRISLWKKELKLLKYILHEVVPVDSQKEKDKALWHGKRCKRLMLVQRVPVSNKQIREAMDYCFPSRELCKPMKFYNDWTKDGPQYFDKAKLRELRKTVEARGEKWRKFKDAATGAKNCPDREYMERLNRKIDADENTL